MAQGEGSRIPREEEVFELVLRVVSVARDTLFAGTIEELKNANPSFDEIAVMCRLFAKMIKNNSSVMYKAADEVIDVMESAAYAIETHCDKTIIDCACHLEDFLGRHQPR